MRQYHSTPNPLLNFFMLKTARLGAASFAIFFRRTEAQRYTSKQILLTSLTVAALSFVSQSAPAETLNILPLGDSITQGGRKDRPEYTYRYDLFCSLQSMGYPIDFIGSHNGGLDADATWPDCINSLFDRDHEGHYGWKTAEVRDQLEAWITKYPAPPDIALIHLGTNDRDAANYINDIIIPLSDIIKILRQHNPKVVVLIGHLNETTPKTIIIRTLVAITAWNLDTEASRVITVAHYQNFNSNATDSQPDTFDGIHPNRNGQKKMADHWMKAMTPFLHKNKQ